MQRLNHSVSPLEQARRGSRLHLKGSKRQLSAADQAILKQVLKGKYEYVKNATFSRPNAQKRLFDDAPPIASPDTSWYHPVMENYSSENRWSGNQVSTVLLTAAEERVLFYQYNYCRYKVCKLKESIGNPDEKAVKADTALEILHWHGKAELLRVQIAQTNLALVLAMAKRTRMTDVDFADLVAEGNMALLRAIDKFDASRGFKFSTYACRAILKAFSRAGVKLSKYRSMFPTDFDPKLERSDYLETKRAEHEGACADEIKQILHDNRADLTDIEQSVIKHRFAVDRQGSRPTEGPTLTLEQVGRIIGVTKERVRQIQNKALEKIRHSLEADYLS